MSTGHHLAQTHLCASHAFCASRLLCIVSKVSGWKQLKNFGVKNNLSTVKNSLTITFGNKYYQILFKYCLRWQWLLPNIAMRMVLWTDACGVLTWINHKSIVGQLTKRGDLVKYYQREMVWNIVSTGKNIVSEPRANQTPHKASFAGPRWHLCPLWGSIVSWDFRVIRQSLQVGMRIPYPYTSQAQIENKGVLKILAHPLSRQPLS